jgi:hypothetical protein
MLQVRGQVPVPQRLPPRQVSGAGGWAPSSSSRSPSSQYERPTLVSPSVSEFSDEAVESMSVGTSERTGPSARFRHQYEYQAPKQTQQGRGSQLTDMRNGRDTNGGIQNQQQSLPSRHEQQFGVDEAIVFGSAADHLTFLSRELFDMHREALSTLREALYHPTSPMQDQSRGRNGHAVSRDATLGVEDPWIAVIEDRVLSQYLDYTMSLQQRLVAAESERRQLQEALSVRTKSNERLTKRVSELEELLLRRHSELSTTPLGTKGMNGSGGFSLASPSSATRPPKQPTMENAAESTPDQRLLQFLRVVERAKGSTSDRSPSTPGLEGTLQPIPEQSSADIPPAEANGRPPLSRSTPTTGQVEAPSPPSGSSFHEELRLLRLELQQANGGGERHWYS